MSITVNELSYVDTFLTSRFKNDATLQTLLGTTGTETSNSIYRVWADLIPEGQAYPGVIYSLQSGLDTTAIGAVRVISRLVYNIKAVSVGDSYVQAAAIADQVTLLVERYKGTQGPVKIDGIYREQPFRFAEVKKGVRYNYVGGLYRIFVSS